MPAEQMKGALRHLAPISLHVFVRHDYWETNEGGGYTSSLITFQGVY